MHCKYLHIWCPYFGSCSHTVKAIGVPTIQPFLYSLCTGQWNLAWISFISVSRCLPLQFCCINIFSTHNWWHRRQISCPYAGGTVQVWVSTVPVLARSFPYMVDGCKMYSHTHIWVWCSLLSPGAIYTWGPRACCVRDSTILDYARDESAGNTQLLHYLITNAS